MASNQVAPDGYLTSGRWRHCHESQCLLHDVGGTRYHDIFQGKGCGNRSIGGGQATEGRHAMRAKFLQDSNNQLSAQPETSVILVNHKQPLGSRD